MKGKVRESDILDRVRDALIEEQVRQAGIVAVQGATSPSCFVLRQKFLVLS